MYDSYEEIGPQPGKQTLAMSYVGEVDFMIWGGARYGGKMVPLDTLVLTDKGFVRNGDLTVGHKVIDPVTGQPIDILAVHPVKTAPTYKLTFEDGATAECCGDHLWEVRRTNKGVKKSGQVVFGEDAYKVYDTKHVKMFVDKAKTASEEGRTGYWPVTRATAPFELTNPTTPTLEPYLLGLFIGDGCVTGSTQPTITSIDPEILSYCSENYTTSVRYKQGTEARAVNFLNASNVIEPLKLLGLYGCNSLSKFLPEEVYTYNLQDRLSLIQGMMDTDGTIHGHGKTEYCTSSEQLAKDFKRLVESVGCVGLIRSKIPTYTHKGERLKGQRSYTVTVQSKTPEDLFRLTRKKDIAKKWPSQRVHRKIVDITINEPKEMRCITVNSKEGLYVITENYVVTHNSMLTTLIPCLYADDPKYRGIFFRNTFGEITGAGSLWDKAEGIYPLYEAWPRQNPLSWNFPEGAKQYYSYMDKESDKLSHRGKGYSFIGFDEIDHFSPSQIQFMFTCLRSEAKSKATMLGTCNPSPDSWLLPLVEYYLDDEGFPTPEKCGVIRYFIIDENENFIFGDSEEYFKENYWDYLNPMGPNGEPIYVPPKTFTYIYFNIYDNEIGMRQEPGYLQQLNNLPDHERKTQLFGNWYAKPKSMTMWDRDWLKPIDRKSVPANCVTARAVDKAHTEPHAKNRYPDFTALSAKIKKDRDGLYYIIGDYHEEIKDSPDKGNPNPVTGKFRKGPGQRDELILKQLKYDNESEKVTLVLPKESGAGKSDGVYTKARMVENKIPVTEGQHTPSNQPDKKIKDFSPFCGACQQGLVYIVVESFHPKTLLAIYRELELFNGEPSTSVKKDDWVDAFAECFNYVASAKRPYKALKVPQSNIEQQTITKAVVRNNLIEEYYARAGTKNHPS